MSSPILPVSSTIMCPHGGLVQAIPTNLKVSAGSLALLQTDTFLVIGCGLIAALSPVFCVTVQWIVAAIQVQVNGVPVLLENSVGLCLSSAGVPLGPPVVIPGQFQALGQ